MPFTEDLDLFLDPVNGVATAATYDGATPVNVIFDEAYLEQFNVSGTRPVVLGKASVFPKDTAIGKTLLINSVSYTIKSREPVDDGAFVLLQLRAP